MAPTRTAPSRTPAPVSLTVALDQAGRARVAADHVRTAILDGTYGVGTRLSEPQICRDLGVSRNTLREAFRALAQERLVVHELNRGVFVRMPSPRDVSELYQVRRLVECAAVATHPGGVAGLGRVVETLDRAGRAADVGDWVAVGTADIDFHRELTALGSVRVVDLMQNVWNEMRLAFHVVDRPGQFHGSYLERNRAMLDLLVVQGGVAVAPVLRTYLDEAEAQVLEAYRVRISG